MRKVAQLKMLIWTFVAVFIGGAAVAFSVLTPPSSVAEQVAAMREKAQPQGALVESADRSPASVQLEFSARPIDNNGQQALDFTLPCEGTPKFSKNVVQVRLSGELCGTNHTAKSGKKASAKSPKREIASTEIRNEANGFSATVFYPKTNTFTTDYMTLSPGTNRIRILHTLKQGGKEEREYVIERSN